MTTKALAFLSLLLIIHRPTSIAQPALNEKPNIIIIMADDLGYGDLSCYGQKKFSTPNIDKLASRGILFTQFYAGAPVCASSRAAFMTGLHTGHTPIRGNKEMKDEGQLPLPDSLTTIPKLLQQYGYTTGAFGKWGLGYPGSQGDPAHAGISRFYGYNCQRLAHNYYPDHLWSDDQKITLPQNQGNRTGAYAPDLIHKQALTFIDANRSKPFFLFYPTTIPHAELVAPPKYMEEFRGKLLPEESYRGIDGGITFRKGPYASQRESHAAFAAMIRLLDDQVGDIVRKVDSLGLDRNTIIIFTSDNGPHVEGGADPDYFDSNGPLRGYKRDVYEGGIRVPCIVSWPGKIKPGKSNLALASWDILPTLSELITSSGLNGSVRYDGISMLPVLTGNGRQQNHEYLYWEFHELGGRQAIRSGKWKLVRYNIRDTTKTVVELYDLAADEGEQNNVAIQHPDVVSKLSRMILTNRTDSRIFQF